MVAVQMSPNISIYSSRSKSEQAGLAARVMTVVDLGGEDIRGKATRVSSLGRFDDDFLRKAGAGGETP